MNRNRLIGGGIINTFLCTEDYFCVQCKVRLECLHNFWRNKCFATSLFQQLCLGTCFAQFNIFLTGLPSNVQHMKCSICAVWICFGEEGSTLTRFTVYDLQYTCKSLLGLCSWFCLGGLKGLYRKVYFAWKWHNYFIVFQGEGCRTVPLSGHVGFDSLPDQLVNKSVNHGFCFNILCVGEYFHFGKFSCWKGFLCSWM